METKSVRVNTPALQYLSQPPPQGLDLLPRMRKSTLRRLVCVAFQHRLGQPEGRLRQRMDFLILPVLAQWILVNPGSYHGREKYSLPRC